MIFRWTTVFAVLVLSSMVMEVELFARMQPNCKLEGLWNDLETSDCLEAQFFPGKLPKGVPKVAVTYYIGDVHYVGWGVYDGSDDVGAKVNLALPGRKILRGWMFCHNHSLYYEGSHPSGPRERIAVFRRASDDENEQEIFSEPRSSQGHWLNEPNVTDSVWRGEETGGGDTQTSMKHLVPEDHSSQSPDGSTTDTQGPPLDLTFAFGNYELVCTCSYVRKVMTTSTP